MLLQSHVFGPTQVLPTVVMHGFATDCSFLSPLINLLPTQHLVFIDLPGYGVNADIRCDIFDEVLDLLEHSLPSRFNLLAWSISSLYAIKLAARLPQSVNKLVTICGTPRFPADPNWPGFDYQLMMKIKQQFTPAKAARLLRLFFTLQASSPRNSSSTNSFIKECAQGQRLPQFEALQSQLDLLGQIDCRTDLKYLTLPKLHLFGAHDHLVPAQIATLLDNNPNTQSFVFTDSAHMPYLTEPQLFAQLLADFL